MNTPVKIKRLSPDAVLPTRGTPQSAGADLYALNEDVTLYPNETKMLPTGISMEIPEGYVGLIFARSSLGIKRGLAPANKVGVIDSDYRGEIMVALHNHSDKPQTVTAGERIAQIVIVPYYPPVFQEADELTVTQRGEGGFGSTGRFSG